MKHMMHSSEKGDEDKRNRQWPDIVSDKENSYWGATVWCAPV